MNAVTGRCSNWMPADPPGEMQRDANDTAAQIEVIVIEMKDLSSQPGRRSVVRIYEMGH